MTLIGSEGELFPIDGRVLDHEDDGLKVMPQSFDRAVIAFREENASYHLASPLGNSRLHTGQAVH